MNAGEVIAGSGLDAGAIGAEVDPVDPFRIGVLKAPTLLRWLWPRGIGAMAFPTRIYLHPRILELPVDRLGGLIVHELVHVRQWADYGRFGFLRRYLGEYLKGRRGGLGHQTAYQSNRLEVEAREVAARLAPTR